MKEIGSVLLVWIIAGVLATSANALAKTMSDLETQKRYRQDKELNDRMTALWKAQQSE